MTSKNREGRWDGRELKKESDEGRLVARRCGELRQKLKGGGSECPESQSEGTAPNGTAWSSLAVTGHSGRGENVRDGSAEKTLPENNRRVREKRYR
jgi:hypothetical protein